MTQPQLLGGRYQLGELLGYGGMAEVHKGRDERLGRDVAVKVLRADLARDSNFQARFRREAQNAGSLNHPAIVAVYDTGDELSSGESIPYIVMEYVEGRTLKDVVIEEGKLMPQRAMEIVADVCAALEFSHKHGIIHRDIKPANVMLTRTGAVKVMDFGIARALSGVTSTMTQTSAVIGTAQYLSPEQARGEAVDARSDVYSTGCLLYELLAEQPPFTGDNPVAVAYQHVREDPIPPGEISSDVTAVMDAVVLKAMAKNPANRYQSAAEMRTDLLRAAAGRAVGAPAVLPSAERTTILPRRERPVAAEPLDEGPRSKKAVTWALVALGLIAIFVVAAFLTSQLFGDEGRKVSVPNVTGKTQAEAIKTLEAKEFKYQLIPDASPPKDKGRVTAQNPGPDEEAERGSKVRITIGKGPNTTNVPDLDDLRKEGVQQKLELSKLTASFTEVDSSKQPGLVISYNPPKGTSVEENSAVEVKISRGNLKPMPDLVGRTLETAQQQLKQQGFTAEPTVTEVDSAKPVGTVVSQKPAAGTDQQPSAPVALEVAKEPEATTPDPEEPDPQEPSSSVPTPPVIVPSNPDNG
ncbi:MAG: Stk1 family PASTA domain-containing Ser/Thr kinase [Mycobacteriales bacterium]